MIHEISPVCWVYRGKVCGSYTLPGHAFAGDWFIIDYFAILFGTFLVSWVVLLTSHHFIEFLVFSYPNLKTFSPFLIK